MLVTVIKTNQQNIAAVTATQKVVTVEDLIVFATKLGVRQQFEEFVEDFQAFNDITYTVRLTDESMFH